jgi:hypothetical protein
MLPPAALEPTKVPAEVTHRGYRMVYRNGVYVGLLPPRERAMNELQRREFASNGWREETIE